MAYTTLEPTMEYFIEPDIGYISYISYKHWLWARSERKIILSDPVCDSQQYKKIITKFLEKYPNVIFVQSSRAMAEVLSNMGFEVNCFGVETDINLVNFDLKGKQRAKLRQWRNKCEREGVKVNEQEIADYPSKESIEKLSRDWLKKKGGKEYNFLVRPLRFENEQDVRYFWAHQNKKLIGLAAFDPIYNNNKVVGYYHNIDRFDDAAPHGTSASIVLHAMEQFKKDGVETLSLGMSPLYLQRGLSKELNYNVRTRKSFWYAFDKLNWIYPFKGNASHKNKFNGEKYPVYFSTTRGNSLPQVFVMLKAIGMLA